ncbi:recombination protein F [Novipirellula aureliae]|uniref:Recombination protein F n=1 Tax=Novipirellula aureliae TaxID=2527966 RepID=A0A5C6DUC8_9BACT|nr:AAA family ATPase [Novipirellula aureliae]TWU39844.1 recombination protein F [Novipirellula aureliae]
MYIARIQITNYRCFKNNTIDFQPGLNVIIGENNGGKTTLLKALTLIFNRRGARRPTVHDFNRLISPSKVPPEIEVAVTLRSSGDADSDFDRGLVASWLTKLNPPWEATLTFSFALPQQDHPEFEKIVGKKPTADSFFDAIDELLPKYVSRIYGGNRSTQMTVDRELLAKFDCQFLDALRDVESEMFSGGSPLFNTMLREVLDANTDGEEVRRLQKSFRKNSKALRDGLVGRLDTEKLFDLVSQTGASDGGEPMLDGGLQESDIIAALRLYIATEKFSFPATHQGLGYNNLIYISLMMASMSFSASKRRGENAAIFPMLLVEEPEAHLHPALQHKLLSHIVSRIGDESNSSRQIFVTTHSTHVTSAVGLEPIICLSVNRSGEINVAYPAKLFPDTKEGRISKNYVARYLDATKSTMLFAKGVVFVEGIAEQLIIPAIANRLSLPLDQSHVAIVRVDGLTFKHFLPLFGIASEPSQIHLSLQRRVACIVDGDPSRKSKGEKNARWHACFPFQLNAEPMAYEYQDISSTALALVTATKNHEQVRVFHATKTLEFDLAISNSQHVHLISESMPHRTHLAELSKNQGTLPRVIKGLFEDDELIALKTIADKEDRERQTYAAAYLKCAEGCKGEHAFAVEQVIRNAELEFASPTYIEDAIAWATQTGVSSA